MNRISFAFRSFFSILFSGALTPDIALAFGYSKPMAVKAAPPPKPQAGPADGAVQILSLLQRDARLVDFLMEDIGAYSDEQVGAAVRDVQAQSRQALERYLQFQPVIDGVEGTYTKTDGVAQGGIKLIGNVPANGKAPGGLLRHKGWQATKVDLPAAVPGMILAPAEIEVE
ncbi:MAG TPA: DUF2760 domain-containing protein [Bryobacteraceae bacterium]|nr:DUF2760 domain-containing protein [Bryobacteraceae bacterium]